MRPKTFPIIMIVLSVLAGMHYVLAGDFRRMVYWLAAATLNATVIY